MTILNRLRNGVAIGGLSLLLAACQTLGGGSGLIASTVTAELTPAGASSIASDMVGQLGAHVGPGATTIRLRGDGSTFGSALEQALRSAGYAVASDTRSGAEAIDLAYAVDTFEGSVMVRLSMVSLDLTRLYQLEGEVALPTSPVSVLRHDELGAT